MSLGLYTADVVLSAGRSRLASVEFSVEPKRCHGVKKLFCALDLIISTHKLVIQTPNLIIHALELVICALNLILSLTFSQHQSSSLMKTCSGCTG